MIETVRRIAQVIEWVCILHPIHISLYAPEFRRQIIELLR
jgi:hypothetical protein